MLLNGGAKGLMMDRTKIGFIKTGFMRQLLYNLTGFPKENARCHFGLHKWNRVGKIRACLLCPMWQIWVPEASRGMKVNPRGRWIGGGDSQQHHN